jgi:predicted methyltransferase
VGVALPHLLDRVAEATSLREGREGVAQVLRIVYAAERITLKDLSRKSGLPVPVLAAVRGELEKAHILGRRAGLILTEQGRQFVQDHLGVTTRHDPLCPTCHGRRIVINENLRPFVHKLEHYFRQAPSVDVTLDQAPCLPETSMRRALYMYQSGALEGKNVIILGDDDLVSLAIGLLGQALDVHTLTGRLTVVEADQRWMDFIQSVSDVENLDLECVQHDLRHPLPETLCQQFDTFETDPPYTTQGMTLFVSRAVRALKPGHGQQGFLSFGSKSPAEMLDVHLNLVNMGLVVHQVIPAFNDYVGASVLGGSSQMIHLLTTAATRSLVLDSHYEESIYTGQSSPTVRLYVCTRCKADYRVGQGQPFTTIELLKAAGCAECGNTSFRYARRVTSQEKTIS